MSKTEEKENKKQISLRVEEGVLQKLRERFPYISTDSELIRLAMVLTILDKV
jgi:hypothetical protein